MEETHKVFCSAPQKNSVKCEINLSSINPQIGTTSVSIQENSLERSKEVESNKYRFLKKIHPSPKLQKKDVKLTALEMLSVR